MRCTNIILLISDNKVVTEHYPQQYEKEGYKLLRPLLATALW